MRPLLSFILVLLPLLSIAQIDSINTKQKLESYLNQAQIIGDINKMTDIIELNKKYGRIQGRHKDPKSTNDMSKTKFVLRKFSWQFITLPGLRFWTKIIYPKTTISHFNTRQAVALTIDDGFCGEDNPQGCMLNEVRHLLNQFDAHVTFFVTGNHCVYNELDEVQLLLKDGHEISNHNMSDWPYHKYSSKDFELDFISTRKILSHYQKEPSKWYRAPFGKLSKNMQVILNKYNTIHVLPDVFAHDTFIPDPEWIAKYILKRVKPGSIILIHMPEKGLREWNFYAIKLILMGLKEIGLKVLNLSELEAQNQPDN